MADSASFLGKREPKDNSETQPIPKKHKAYSEEKEINKGFASETYSDEANLIPVKEIVEGLDETPPLSVQDVLVRKKTVFVQNLSCLADIPDIINFFKDVGKVVHVRLTVDCWCKRMFSGYIEFASLAEAKKALEKKNGECLLGLELTLDSVAAKRASLDPQPQYYIEHKVWHEDHLLLRTLPIGKDDTVEGLVESPLSAEADEFTKSTLLVAHLSPQTNITHIINFFRVAGEVVGVRLIVSHEGKHVGYCFVEFASAYEANKALKKNGEFLHDHKIFLDVAKTAPYPLRPRHNIAEKLWYEDYLLRESLEIEEDETLEGCDQTPHSVEAVSLRKKRVFFHISINTKLPHIINFFKDVGEVVHVRRMVNHRTKHLDRGFVEFASANEAKKALEKNRKYLRGSQVHLAMAKASPSLGHISRCIDHKVWFADLLRESILIEEDEVVEGVDETPDFVEEVAVTKQTLFISNLPPKPKIKYIVDFFEDVGQVVSVQLCVNQEGHSVGCGYVEFVSANVAKKALKKKNGRSLTTHFIRLDTAKIAPYPLRPKYKLAEKLWYEDYRLQESLLIEEEDSETKSHMGVFCGKKITFFDDD